MSTETTLGETTQSSVITDYI